METWLKERVLHRYLIENFSKYRVYNSKIFHVDDNKDKFPDLFFTLENKKRIPVEVEWETKNFDRHDHDINYLKKRDGVLFVCDNNKDLGIPQIQIKIADFEKWFEENAKSIIQDTTSKYKKNDAKKTEVNVVWFIYLSLKAGGSKHFQRAIETRTWGVPEKFPAILRFKSIQKNDLVAFIGPGKQFAGRIKKTEWKKSRFKGFFERIQLFRVTKGYFYDKTPNWKPVGSQWKNEVWPHRFEFCPQPIIDLTKIQINQLNSTSKENLYDMIFSNVILGESTTLQDVFIHGIQNF